MVLDTLGRWGRAVYGHDLHSTGLDICHADIADPGWIFSYLGSNLFVTCHLLRSASVIPFFHRQFFEVGVGPGRGVAGVDRYLAARTTYRAPIGYIASENLFDLLLR